MLTFLFWNVGGELPKSAPAAMAVARNARLRGIIGNLAKAHDVDLVILAECPLSQNEVLQELNRGSRAAAYRKPDPNSQCERIAIYPRFYERSLNLRSESSKYTGRRVKLPGRTEFLLFAA